MLALAVFAPSTQASQTAAAKDGSFVTTYGDLKAADLPICGYLPEETKAQIWHGKPTAMTDQAFAERFGDDAPMFGVRGATWWYLRETRKVVGLEGRVELLSVR